MKRAIKVIISVSLVISLLFAFAMTTSAVNEVPDISSYAEPGAECYFNGDYSLCYIKIYDKQNTSNYINITSNQITHSSTLSSTCTVHGNMKHEAAFAFIWGGYRYDFVYTSKQELPLVDHSICGLYDYNDTAPYNIVQVGLENVVIDLKCRCSVCNQMVLSRQTVTRSQYTTYTAPTYEEDGSAKYNLYVYYDPSNYASIYIPVTIPKLVPTFTFDNNYTWTDEGKVEFSYKYKLSQYHEEQEVDASFENGDGAVTLQVNPSSCTVKGSNVFTLSREETFAEGFSRTFSDTHSVELPLAPHPFTYEPIWDTSFVCTLHATCDECPHEEDITPSKAQTSAVTTPPIYDNYGTRTHTAYYNIDGKEKTYTQDETLQPLTSYFDHFEKRKGTIYVVASCPEDTETPYHEHICQVNWNEDLTSAELICDRGEIIKGFSWTSESELVSNVPSTCALAGSKTFRATFTEGEETITSDIVQKIAKDSSNHAGGTYTDGYKEATYTSEGYSGDEYCSGCHALLTKGSVLPMLEMPEGEVPPESEEQKNPDELSKEEEANLREEIKEEISSILGGENDEEKTPEEKAKQEEVKKAVENLPIEKVNEIYSAVSEELDKINELFEGKGDDEKAEIQPGVFLTKNEAKDILAAVTSSALLAGKVEQDSEEDILETIENLPEGSEMDIGGDIENFFEKLMSDLLGSSGIDYSISKEIYEKAAEFARVSVENIIAAAKRVKNCPMQVLKALVNSYSSEVSNSSFRNYDKEAADNEFLKLAYTAILTNLQEITLSQLDELYQQNRTRVSGSELQKLTEQYEKDKAAVSVLQSDDPNDTNTFEYMIIEIMRLKYISLINEKVDSGEISAADYEAELPKVESATTFRETYMGIFRAWALSEEIPGKVKISLEELSNATVEYETKALAVTENPGDLTATEKTAVAAVSGIASMAVGGYTFLAIRRKEDIPV